MQFDNSASRLGRVVNFQNAPLWLGQQSMTPTSIEFLNIGLIMRLILRAQAVQPFAVAVLLALDVWQRLGV